MSRPSLFVGSSSEGLEIARAAEFQLRDVAEITLWNEGFFGLGQSTLEALVNALERFDFAILVVTPDDLVVSRGEESARARDNVMLELGLFMGRLGRARTFVLSDATRVRLPSDLAGVTVASFDSDRGDGNLIAAVGPATTLMRKTIRDLGALETRATERLERATESVVQTSAHFDRLIYLMARSRVAELEVVSTQFGGMIARDLFAKILKDLDDLQRATAMTEEDGAPAA